MRKNIYLIIILMICELLSQFTAFAQWKKVTTIPPPYDNGPNQGGYYLEVMFLPSNPKLGWTCGFNGYVLRTVDGGNTWHGTVVQPGLQLESINFLDSLNGYTSGYPKEFGNEGRIFKSTDGGVTWFNVTPPDPGYILWGNYFLTPNIGVVIGGGCGNVEKFYHTSDGGASWSLFEGNDNSGMTDAILFSPNGLGYAVSSGRLWRTSDGGLTWSIMSVTGGEDWQEEITISGNTFLLPYATGCGGEMNDGGLRISTDGGINWKQFRTGHTMFGAFLLDSKRGWGVGTSKAIYYTSDAGKTWELRNCGIQNNDSLDDVYFINDTTGWVVGNGIYKYVNLDTLHPSITAYATTKCEGDSVILTANENYNYYNWSTGETTKSITVRKSGKYWVNVSNSECDTSKSNEIQINFNPAPSPGIIPSDTLVCQGDSVTLTLDKPYPVIQWSNGETSQSIHVFSDSTYSVIVTDTNGCTGTASIHITVIPNPKPFITKYSHMVSCIGDTVFLETSPDFSSYTWYEANKNQLINTGSNKISVVSNGDYYLIVSNKYGCTGTSDTMKIVFVPDSNRLSLEILSSGPGYLTFDSVSLTTMLCKRLRIKNVGSDPEIINNLILARNIEFSLPQSQFPITILPSESADVEICYNPSAIGEQYDTLQISDHCTPHEVPLVGIGAPNIYNGNSNCSIPVRLQSTDLIGYFFNVSAPIPNPAQSIVSLKFERYVPSGESQVETGKLFNSLGIQVSAGYEKLTQSGCNDKGTYNIGNFTFDINYLPDGLYYAIIYSKNNKFIYPVIISR